MTIREKAAMMKLDSSKMASTDIAVRKDSRITACRQRTYI